MGNVPAPSAGLKGNSNYFLCSNGNPVTDLSVTIQVTESTVGGCGFGFQLNANSPLGANITWQQYVVMFDPTEGPTPVLKGQVNNWATDHAGVFIEPPPFLTLPGTSPTLPAGYQLTISLTNDASGNIISVTFTAVDNQGNVTSQVTLLPANPLQVAPIYSFALVLVGKTNAEDDYLTAGAGTITYSATSTLTVLNQQPAYSTSNGTAEQSNSVYGELPASANTEVVQTFSTAVPPTYTPGGRFAVSRQVGLDQTNLYAVCRTGQLVVFSVQAEGHWRFVTRLGAPGLCRPNAMAAATEQFGANHQTDVFVVGQAGFDGGGKRKVWMFSVNGAGAWSAPREISVGLYKPSGYLAASRRFGYNRTDLFLIDTNGQLNVFSAHDAGAWTTNPLVLGASKFAPEGAPLAASHRSGVPDQTDVFVVDNLGQLNVFSDVGAAGWIAPVAIGAKGLFPLGAHIAASHHFGVAHQTDVFAVDNNGQLNAFWVHFGGSWSAPVKIGPSGFASPGAPVAASHQFGAMGRTDVFLVDKAGTLQLFWVDNGGLWQGPKQLGPSGLAPSGAFVAVTEQFGAPNQTDVFLINQTGTNGPGWPTQFWVGGSGPWGGPVALVTEA